MNSDGCGVSEAQVLEILEQLPQYGRRDSHDDYGRPVSDTVQDSFIYRYVRSLSQTIDTHIGHHVSGALSVMSQLVPHYINFPFGIAPIHANFFGLLVGSSGSRKTGAVNAARNILMHAGVPTVASAPASREAFIDSLTDDPKKFIAYGEFGDFLSSSAAGSVLAPLRTVYNDAADCSPIRRERVRRRRADTGETDGGETGNADPRVTVIGAVAPAFLDAHTDSDDWGGGFFARFFTTYCERERLIEIPENGMPVIEEAAGYVQRRFAEWCGPMAPTFAECGGFTPEAREVYKAWARKNDRPVTSAVAVEAATNRLGAHAIRVALLISWDLMAPRGIAEGYDSAFRGIHYTTDHGAAPLPKWYVTQEVITVAMKIVEALHLTSVQQIAGNLAPTREERIVVGVTRALTHADKDGRGLTTGELSKELRRSPKEIDNAIVTLVSRGDATKRTRFGTQSVEFVLRGSRADVVVDLAAARERHGAPLLNATDVFPR